MVSVIDWMPENREAVHIVYDRADTRCAEMQEQIQENGGRNQ